MKNVITLLIATLSLILGMAACSGGSGGSIYSECPSGQPYCTCADTNDDEICVRRRARENGAGNNNDLTCDNKTPSASARTWSMTVVDNTSKCATTGSRYANSEADAVACLQAARGTSVTVHAGNNMCEFYFTKSCGGGSACSDDNLLGRTRAEAVACYEWLYPSCRTRDVSNHVNPTGVCHPSSINGGRPCPR